MDELSDSDFDFELQGPFETVGSEPDCINLPQSSLQHRQTTPISQPQVVSRPPSGDNTSKAGSVVCPANDQVRLDLYKAIGENTILRTRLDNVEQEHRSRINELLTAQVRAREEQREQLEELRKKLQVERYQHDLQLKDMKAQMIPMNTRLADSATNVRKTRDEPFSDGFEVKKPRIASVNPPRNFSAAVVTDLCHNLPAATPNIDRYTSTDASASTGIPDSANTTTPQNPNQTGSGKPSEYAQRVALYRLLLRHVAPGNHIPTLRTLYPQSSHSYATVGEDLANSCDCDDLISKILSHKSFYDCDFTSDVPAVIMSLLASTLLLPYKLNEHTQAQVVERITDSTLRWLTNLRPLPSLEEVQKYGSISVETLRQYNYVLWALDTLVTVNWHFNLSTDLIRSVFSRHNCPPLHSRGYELIAKHPSIELTKILVSEVPKPVVIEYRHKLVRILPNHEVPGGLKPSTELLFRGLRAADDGRAVLEYTSKLPAGATHVTLVDKTYKFDNLVALALRQARTYVVKMQCDWLHAAVCSLPSPPAFASTSANDLCDKPEEPKKFDPNLDRAVLSLLSCALQDSLFPSSPVLARAMLYFWSRDTESLRTTMSVPDLTELIVCLAIIVQNNVNTNDIVTQSRAMLSELAVDGELDNYFDAFRPRSEWNEADYTIDGSDASMDEMIIKAEQMFP